MTAPERTFEVVLGELVDALEELIALERRDVDETEVLTVDA